jgi:hypothetical protein
MEQRRFSDYERGAPSALLADAYSGSPELVERYAGEWDAFDSFLYANLAVMDRCGFISVEDGRPIGFISWDPRNLPATVEIGHNCIVRAQQGLGKGRVQLLIGIDRMRGLNPERILVRTGTGPFFLPARKMYLAAGFRPVRTIDRGEGVVPAVIDYELRERSGP